QLKQTLFLHVIFSFIRQIFVIVFQLELLSVDIKQQLRGREQKRAVRKGTIGAVGRGDVTMLRCDVCGRECAGRFGLRKRRPVKHNLYCPTRWLPCYARAHVCESQFRTATSPISARTSYALRPGLCVRRILSGRFSPAIPRPSGRSRWTMARPVARAARNPSTLSSGRIPRPR
ncbi:uncharacterized protein DEA37_0002096, partial [Paragonimus westermani]